METLLHTALAYLGQGLSVIPVTRETKAPRLAHWQPYQERRATPAEVVETVTALSFMAVEMVSSSSADWPNEPGPLCWPCPALTTASWPEHVR